MEQRLRMSIAALCVLVIACILCAGFNSPEARASAADDLQAQIDAKNNEIQKLQADAAAYRAGIAAKADEAHTVKNQVATITLTLKKITTNINLSNAEIARTQLEIAALGKEITVKAAAIDAARKSIGDLLVNVSQQDAGGILLAIAKYRTLSDFFDSLYYVVDIERGIQGQLVSLRTLKGDLEADKSTNEAKRAQLATLLSGLNAQKAVQQSQRQERARVLADAQHQEAKLQQQLNLTQAQIDSIQQDIEGLENKLRQTVNPGALPAKRSGVLGWPVTGTISQGYGVTAFAIRSDFYSFHNGIDIRAPIGTPVGAAGDGVVIATGNSDLYCPRGAYGKYIVIRHPNNLTTLYAHLSSIRVFAGDSVSAGDVIGLTGMTGLTTGPHLHFTVYDSSTVEVRQSRVCGLLPYGGSVDPMDYL